MVAPVQGSYLADVHVVTILKLSTYEREISAGFLRLIVAWFVRRLDYRLSMRHKYHICRNDFGQRKTGWKSLWVLHCSLASLLPQAAKFAAAFGFKR